MICNVSLCLPRVSNFYGEQHSLKNFEALSLLWAIYIIYIYLILVITQLLFICSITE